MTDDYLWAGVGTRVTIKPYAFLTATEYERTGIITAVSLATNTVTVRAPDGEVEVGFEDIVPPRFTDKQQKVLDHITAADLAWREAKKTAKAKALADAEAEVRRLRDSRDALVLNGVREGLPLIELRRKQYGLHTTNANTVLEAMKRAEQA